MIDKATISNPTTHYGSGKHATRHFITQRITGALNIAFLLFFIWFVVSVAGQDRAGAIATIANPFVAIPLGLLFVSGCGSAPEVTCYVNPVSGRRTGERRCSGWPRTIRT